MFRFWYRYVFTNRTFIETGAVEGVWSKKIEPDYNNYNESAGGIKEKSRCISKKTQTDMEENRGEKEV